MAALATTRYPLMWLNGESDRVALYALRDVSAGDLCDLAQEFTVLKRAVIMGTTVAAATSATVGTGADATKVTIPAGASRDAGYLLVYGAAGPA
ncbi:hypothetical protein DEJ49_33485 [Streptomyces venezuelae]|uniref:Uncharacterized protein n=1 Tax=Streptomyces venezuelae TaxID=54571 RepID=A0A5P2CS66_STRVZ|nr:hypothetical protein [Streptomyces venezuelae]QES45253.1 hypothetical protein DEJ49_33485 [Streptomyces venezuelae]